MLNYVIFFLFCMLIYDYFKIYFMFLFRFSCKWIESLFRMRIFNLFFGMYCSYRKYCYLEVGFFLGIYR